MNACQTGLDRFIEQTDGTDKSVDVKDLIGGKNTCSDLLWLAGETLSKDKIVRFACDCALISIELIRPYTNEYDLIHSFLLNPTADTADAAAYAAAYAANAAADAAAYSAARAAYSAARAAAYAARAAADAADAAAYSAARAAADADADAAKVNELLVKLFDGE